MSITSVGPERPKTVMDNPDNDIRIEWAPFGKTDNAIDLTSKMLMRPNCHGNQQCKADYQDFIAKGGDLQFDAGVDALNEPTRWLLIDRSDISMTGNDCNQIGLLYTGFRNQGENKCIRSYESCLDKVEVNGRLMSSARILDYLDADLDAVIAQQVGRYFPQYLYPGSALAVERTGDDFAALAYEVDEYRVSQLTLIMSGTLVAVREFTGKLQVPPVFALACMGDDFTPKSCFSNIEGSIESASKNGLISVTLRNIGEYPDMYTVSFPYEHFEYKEEDGSYTNMASVGSADLSPMPAKSTDSLPGRLGNTKQCEPGTLFRQTISEMASECWKECEEENAGRRLQGAVDPTGGGSGPCDTAVQCGGVPSASGRIYPDLRDDCDTVSFQVHSNNGLQREYCVRIEVRNSLGALEFPTGPNAADEGRLCFNTTEIDYKLVGDAEDAFAAGGEPLRVDPAMFDCSTFCPGTLDFLCMLGQPACQDGAFLAIGFILVIVIGCCVAKRLGLFKLIPCCLLIPGCGEKKKKKKKRGTRKTTAKEKPLVQKEDNPVLKEDDDVGDYNLD
jgi:hypothetical protein